MVNFFPILEEAFAKGAEALKQCVPTPVRFYPADLNDKPLGPGTVDLEGNCGGAYVSYIDGNSELVRFFKKHGKGEGDGYNAQYTLSDGTKIRKGVYKGYTLHAPTSKIYNDQSHERYKAFYTAYATVLKNNGVKCSVKDYLT